MILSKVSLYTIQQIKQDGSKPIIGGAERYMWDIAALFRKMGHEVEFFQNGTHNWVKDFNGYKITALKLNPGETWDKNAERFDQISSEKVFYSWYGQAAKFKYPGISICHGIWFDWPGYTEHMLNNDIKPTIERAIKGSGALVSVDTAFINYCRGAMPSLVVGNEKLQYIPNYVDLKVFYPQEKTSNKDKITILYPRRLDLARGIEEMKVMTEKLLLKYPHVDFIFAIDNNIPEAWNEFVQWRNSLPYKERVKYRTYNFNEIHEAYREADIVIIPTQRAEGTSLSCLEAMAMGKPVVATIVGGLTDLILNNYNGLLVNTNIDSMMEGLCKLIEDKSLREKLSHNAILTSKEFSKERWEEQWSKIISKFY